MSGTKADDVWDDARQRVRLWHRFGLELAAIVLSNLAWRQRDALTPETVHRIPQIDALADAARNLHELAFGGDDVPAAMRRRALGMHLQSVWVEFDHRIRSRLQREGMKTLGDVTQISRKEMESWRQWSRATVNYVEQELRRWGLQFASEDEDAQEDTQCPKGDAM